MTYSYLQEDTAEAWEPSWKQCCCGNRGAMDKVPYFTCRYHAHYIVNHMISAVDRGFQQLIEDFSSW